MPSVASAIYCILKSREFLQAGMGFHAQEECFCSPDLKKSICALKSFPALADSSLGTIPFEE